MKKNLLIILMIGIAAFLVTTGCQKKRKDHRTYLQHIFSTHPQPVSGGCIMGRGDRKAFPTEE